jgi:hypothetical protein
MRLEVPREMALLPVTQARPRFFNRGTIAKELQGQPHPHVVKPFVRRLIEFDEEETFQVPWGYGATPRQD